MSRRPLEPAGFRTARTGGPPIALVLGLAILCPLGGSCNVAAAHMAPPLFHVRTGLLEVTLSAEPSTGSVPLLVDFAATTNSTTVQWFDWSFGDGNTLNGSSNTTRSPTHWYGAAGTYDATVEAFDGDAIGRANVTIRVLPVALVVDIQTSRIAGPAPLSITFTAIPRGGSGTYTTFDWRFGDGAAGAGLAVNHTYGREGEYAASVLVVDSAGASASASIPVNVTAASATSPAASGPFAGGSAWITLALAAPFITGAVALASWEWSRRRETRAGSTGAVDEPAGGGGVARPPVPPGGRIASSGTEVSPSGPGPLLPPPIRFAPGAGGSGPREIRSVSPSEMGPPPELRRASQRIIVHLGSQEGIRPNELPGRGRTQAGMSEELGIPKNVLSNVLRRLVSAGVLTVETGHVRGADRRMKAYQLTPKGETLSRELRHRRQASVSSDPGTDPRPRPR